jgi:hypothetical protein
MQTGDKPRSFLVSELDYGVSRNDTHQVYAYGKRYDCPEIFLVYPHHDDIASSPGLLVDNFHLPQQTSAPPQAIRVCTIEVSSNLGNPQVNRDFRVALRGLMGLAP